MKISNLSGVALDWAVAKCEGLCEPMMRFDPTLSETKERVRKSGLTWTSGYRRLSTYSPSTDWSQGGPIIERERICLGINSDDGGWECEAQPVDCGRDGVRFGPTPLIAAMRCYVASKLGDEIDIPKELK